MNLRNLRQLAIAGGVALCTLGIASAQGSVSGTCVLDGPAPKMKKIKMAQEQSCEKHHKEPLRQEDVVIGADGKSLANVFVYVKNAPAGAAAATGEVTIDQIGCQYKPHVFGIRVGQTLKILNSDNGVLHNIHAFGEPGNTFNMGQPGNGQPLTQKFQKAQLGVPLKCDVHGWMKSYACVVEHPYFAVTDDKGAFKIDNLPPGEYELEAWQEVCGTQSAKVKVEAAGGAPVTFTFKAPAKEAGK